MRVILLISLFVFGSCASYVNKMHRQIDQDERVQKYGKNVAPPQRRRANPYNQYYRGHDKRPVNQPITLGRPVRANTRNTKNLPPQSNRNFDTFGKRRVTADDLKDNGQSGSLWTGKHSESFLFVTNNIKRAGDIVIVEVMSPLKAQIEEELKRTFPEARKKKKSSSKKEEAKAEKPKEEVAATNAEDDPKKVYDKISTQVVEEVNQDYLLVRGRKEIMFKTRKRFIEFQALVSRKDITTTDAVKSTKVLEPRISVLRY